jgi:hypothetical protein
MKATHWVLMLGCALMPLELSGAARNSFTHELKGCSRESSGRVVCRVAITHQSNKTETYPPKSQAVGRLVVDREYRSYDFDIEGPTGERGLTKSRLAGGVTFHVLWYFQRIPADAQKAEFEVMGMPKGPVTIQIAPDKPGQGRGRR